MQATDETPVARRRKCTKCTEEKNVSEFRPDKKASNGRLYPRNQCRKCESADWRRDWRAGKKDRQSSAVLALKAPRAALRDPIDNGFDRHVLEESIERRMALYGLDALDAVHDLAVMPISTNSAQNQVKLMAAKLLVSPWLGPEMTEQSTDLQNVLKQLNQEYKENAPRIKAIRERSIEFEQDPCLTIESEKLH